MNIRWETDLQLVEAAKAGDTHAFGLLMNRHKSRLTRQLSSLIQDSGEVDDAIQETFIRAYLGLNGFRGDAAFATWLYRIAVNTAMSSLVKNSRRRRKLALPADNQTGNQLHPDSEADLDTPEATLESKEILALLDAALNALPDDQRMSLVLRELEGLSYEEIAAHMHCPVGTVRSRIHRARDNLAARLKRH